MKTRQKAAAVIRTLGQLRRKVFLLPTIVAKSDKEDVAAAYKLANETLSNLKEECLLQDIPLVVACMEDIVLKQYIDRFRETLRNRTIVAKGEADEKHGSEEAAEKSRHVSADGGGPFYPGLEVDAEDHS